MENSTKHITIFVTGASGYLANRLVLDLLEAGYQVRGTARTLEKGESLKTRLCPPKKITAESKKLSPNRNESNIGWSQVQILLG